MSFCSDLWHGTCSKCCGICSNWHLQYVFGLYLHVFDWLNGLRDHRIYCSRSTDWFCFQFVKFCSCFIVFFLNLQWKLELSWSPYRDSDRSFVRLLYSHVICLILNHGNRSLSYNDFEPTKRTALSHDDSRSCLGHLWRKPILRNSVSWSIHWFRSRHLWSAIVLNQLFSRFSINRRLI